MIAGSFPTGAAVGGKPSLELADIAAAIDKRLFIGRVPPEVSEADIFSVFSLYGALTEVRREAGSQTAIVGYESWGCAHKALLQTDQKLQFGEGTVPCLVSFAERPGSATFGAGNPYEKGMDVTRVFIGGLPQDATDDELCQRFAAMGAIINACMLPNKHASRPRCAFVSFETWGEALDAVECLHKVPLREGDSPMTVALAEPKGSQRDMASQGQSMGGVSMGGQSMGGQGQAMGGISMGPISIGPLGAANAAVIFGNGSPQALGSFGEPAMKRSKFGSIPLQQQQAQLQLQQQPQNNGEFDQLFSLYTLAVYGGKPRAECDALHEQLMQRVYQVGAMGFQNSAQLGMQGAMVLAKPVKVAQPAGIGDRAGARLFIGGMPPAATDEDLAALVSQVPMQTSPEGCALLECRALPGKGCGYLRFVSPDAAEEVLHALSGQYVEAWQATLRVQWATERAPDAGDAAKEWQSQEQVESMGCEATRLFVGQLMKDSQNSDPSLRPMFEGYGTVVEFKWVQEKGVAYVGYSSFIEAQAALQNLRGQAVPGISRGMSITYAKRAARRF